MFSSSLSRTVLRPALKQLHFSTHVKEIKKIGVVGLGLMGHGVAQVSAMAGYEVVGIESNDAALSAGVTRIHDSLGKVLSKDVKKGKMTEVTFFSVFFVHTAQSTLQHITHAVYLKYTPFSFFILPHSMIYQHTFFHSYIYPFCRVLWNVYETFLCITITLQCIMLYILYPLLPSLPVPFDLATVSVSVSVSDACLIGGGEEQTGRRAGKDELQHQSGRGTRL